MARLWKRRMEGVFRIRMEPGGLYLECVRYLFSVAGGRLRQGFAALRDTDGAGILDPNYNY